MSISMKGQFGRPLEFPPHIRGRIHPDCDTPEFINQLRDMEALLQRPGARILHKDRNRITALSLDIPSFQPQDIVIKEFRPRGLKKGKTLFLPSSAIKAWKGAAALHQNNLNTPFPLAYLEERRRGIVTRSYIITEHIREGEEIRSFFQSSASDTLKPLLIRIAGFLKLCHSAGIYHRDLSDGNVLVKGMNTENPVLYLIDTNRIRLSRRIGRFKGVKGLIRLGIPQELQDFFLKEYSRPEELTALQWTWYRLNKNIYAGFITFKKRLGLKRIAEKLGLQ